MPKPALIIMAAGMGSRYGGTKQAQPVGASDQLLADYALYDAMRAGFETAILVIRPSMADDFPDQLRGRVGNRLKLRFVVQSLEDLPPGHAVPSGRVKPWGTGHAVYACRHVADSPVAVINADDYYGPASYRAMFDFLSALEPGASGLYAMVGYRLGNTLSENGTVSRGICTLNDAGQLLAIQEHPRIVKTPDGIRSTLGEEPPRRLPEDAVVSLNLWGFPSAFFGSLERQFDDFLTRSMPDAPLTSELYLPEVVGKLVRDHQAKVAVLPTQEQWYGITYPEDLKAVASAIAAKTRSGQYPEQLWR
ncbi:MAG TPA: nucleotidyltransferase [Clostridia bacterium]|nr:nucleotidyltransferase [Clostridia bacterium]